jgi:hypothetical protein
MGGCIITSYDTKFISDEESQNVNYIEAKILTCRVDECEGEGTLRHVEI